MKRYLIGILVVSLLLVGCLTEEDYEVQTLEIQDKSDLYGVWHFTEELCLWNFCDPDFYLILGADSSYYVAVQKVGEQDHAILTPLPMNWSLLKGGVLDLSPNWRWITLFGLKGYPVSRLNYGNVASNYDSSVVYVVSNADSIIRASEIYDSASIGSSATVESKYKIIQWNKAGESERLHLIEEDCYSQNPGVSDYSNICGVDILEKQNSFDVKKMFSQADTLSSTVVWLNTLSPYTLRKDFWPKDSSGADIMFPRDSITGWFIDFE